MNHDKSFQIVLNIYLYPSLINVVHIHVELTRFQLHKDKRVYPKMNERNSFDHKLVVHDLMYEVMMMLLL